MESTNCGLQTGDRSISQQRASQILAICRALEDAVVDLDDLQAGDYNGRISPVKHELRDALAPIINKIRAIARAEYEEE